MVNFLPNKLKDLFDIKEIEQNKIILKSKLFNYKKKKNSLKIDKKTVQTDIQVIYLILKFSYALKKWIYFFSCVEILNFTNIIA